MSRNDTQYLHVSIKHTIRLVDMRLAATETHTAKDLMESSRYVLNIVVVLCFALLAFCYTELKMYMGTNL